MGATVISPPQPLFTAGEARAQLGLTAADDALDLILDAATSMLDAPNGWLGIAIGEQVLEIERPACEDGRLLPYPPLVELISKAPSTDGRSVTTRYKAGHANVPGNLKYAVLLQARHLHNIGTRDLFLSQRSVEGVGSRSWVVSEVSGKLIANAVQSLVGHMRIPRL